MMILGLFMLLFFCLRNYFYLLLQFMHLNSLYHDEWRTKETLVDQGTANENEIATFSFRGFKGDYDLKLMDGETELKSWTLNLDKDSEWVLEY